MYYPDQRHLMAWTTVRRERLLPEGAIGTVEVRKGQTVNLTDVVVRGSLPARYVYVEVAAALRLRPDAELADLLLVELGEAVEAGQPIAGRSATRGPRALAPADGIVSYVGQGRIIIQTTPETVELEAGLVGAVTAVIPNRGVTIEAFGALIQGVWGNGQRAIGPLRIEPEGGLEAIIEDSIEREYSGAVVFTRRPLTAAGLANVEAQRVRGVIAPGMDAALLPRVQEMNCATLLLEGFGQPRVSPQTVSLLENFRGRQATLDAHLPGRWDTQRLPEVFINLPPKSGDRPPAPDTENPLQPGAVVRLTREPYPGWIGTVVDLPRAPQEIGNGLRVPCARVSLATGETLAVPLANLEYLGR